MIKQAPGNNLYIMDRVSIEVCETDGTLETQIKQATAPLEHSVRQNWEEQFQTMAEAGDDSLLDSEPLILTNWEANNWMW